MRKILTTAGKELLLLKRDRTGLMVLFLMPALLVIVITLVQENVMELTGQKTTRLLFLDLDQGRFGDQLQKRLSAGKLAIISWDSRLKKEEDVKRAVAAGEYQAGIVINAQTSLLLQEKADHLFSGLDAGSRAAPERIPVAIYFDPGIMPGLRSSLTAQLQMVLEAIAVQAKLAGLGTYLHGLADQLGVDDKALLPAGGLAPLIEKPFFDLQDQRNSAQSPDEAVYNPVQQNVPAWALFGMFFTAIPIAGAILQERKSGIWIRLKSMPVSHLYFIGGKIAAYVAVCLSQFLLIGLIGRFLFPLLGLPAFAVAGKVLGVLVIVFSSSLAACGFGILLGMSCMTYEQASTLGSTAVVAAAALGGVMVPVYAMPQAMQRLSVLSPLNWGLTAFQGLLMRGYSLAAVADDLGRLLLFFLLTILVSWKLSQARV